MLGHKFVGDIFFQDKFVDLTFTKSQKKEKTKKEETNMKKFKTKQDF